MNSLIDAALETILHSAIWRSTWHMEFKTLIAVAVCAFLLLAYRRTRKPTRSRGRKRRGAYKFRKRYPK